ncbi:MAG: tail-specific protease, partial [Proteobacteria bacterium]|nr:tail-specific protease [Pseudomonadota bacterium]
KAGDRIVGVAQGDKSAMTDVVGWRLDDVVALIRGTLDSTVILDVIPSAASPDAEHKLVSLIRKKITLEDQAAKKSILPLNDNGVARRIGVISLPTFYEDFQARQKGDPDFKSATRDVSRLLGELKNEKVDGVLIDLRNNGGGSLTEAIELTSLFLGAGPVVQQRDAHGEISVARGEAPREVWNGPLAVLINRASASASEIFAAAIQDRRRGLVIGETSFGKGTVQTMVNLDQIAQSQAAQLGDLKLTIAQFFRINGSTTQLRGVTPDITLPSASDSEHFGESSFGNGVPWMRIKPVTYQAAAELQGVLPTLRQRHDRRVAKDKDYQDLLGDIAEFEKRSKTKTISLNETERRRERDALEAKLKSRGKKIVPSNADVQEDGDQEPEKQGENAKDVLLQEAAHILGDTVELLGQRPSLASRVQPSSSQPAAGHAVE